MTKPLSIFFVSQNSEKIREAQCIGREYGVEVVPLALDIDEIQHHEPLKITEHKARVAYAAAGRSVVVNDSFWQIPALGGFPGGYMKDVSRWFSVDDWLKLMYDYQDKTIVLTDVNGYFDGQAYKAFKLVRRGKFIETPLGASDPPFGRVVVMDGDSETIAQKIDIPNRPIDPEAYTNWRDFMHWYTLMKG